MPLSRRAFAAALALLLVPAAAGAADKTVQMELKKLFPYLEAYLALPAQERSRFHMAYRIRLKGAPQGALRLAYPDGPVSISADGQPSRLPGLAALRSGAKASLTAPQGSSLDMGMAVAPSIAPAAELDAQALAESVRQAAAGSKKAVGVMRFAVPAMERVTFHGAAGAMVIAADGSVKPLPVVKGQPVFDPKAHPAARRIRFSRPPQRMSIGPAK